MIQRTEHELGKTVCQRRTHDDLSAVMTFGEACDFLGTASDDDVFVVGDAQLFKGIAQRPHLAFSIFALEGVTLSTIAPTLPKMIAARCCLGGSDRDARAMTTALSPLNMMLTRMIWARAIRKTEVVSMSMGTMGSVWSAQAGLNA